MRPNFISYVRVNGETIKNHINHFVRIIGIILSNDGKNIHIRTTDNKVCIIILNYLYSARKYQMNYVEFFGRINNDLMLEEIISYDFANQVNEVIWNDMIELQNKYPILYFK
jgi:hypothetical protein